eukprot:2456111-Pleurochrysis_carterae.AAC.1
MTATTITITRRNLRIERRSGALGFQQLGRREARGKGKGFAPRGGGLVRDRDTPGRSGGAGAPSSGMGAGSTDARHGKGYQVRRLLAC